MQSFLLLLIRVNNLLSLEQVSKLINQTVVAEDVTIILAEFQDVAIIRFLGNSNSDTNRITLLKNLGFNLVVVVTQIEIAEKFVDLRVENLNSIISTQVGLNLSGRLSKGSFLILLENSLLATKIQFLRLIPTNASVWLNTLHRFVGISSGILLLLHDLLLFLGQLILLHLLLDLSELLHKLIQLNSGTIVPLVSLNLGNRQSVDGVKSQHIVHKRLEFLAIKVLRLRALMSLPEILVFASANLLVVLILRSSSAEGESTTNHNEQNDTSSKKINSRALIRLLKVDLGSHISLGTQNSVQVRSLLMTLNHSSVTKIGDLQIEVLVQKEVLRLEISVADAVVVAILDTFDELLEVSSSQSLAEISHGDDVLKELTTFNDFHDDQEYLIALSVLLDVVDGFVSLDQVDDVGVIYLLQHISLLRDSVNLETLVTVRDDLASSHSTSLHVLTKLNFSVVTTSQGFHENVVSASSVLLKAVH